jgi:hypothetical protein
MSSNGLGEMGVVHHDFLSMPMLLNSSELIFETNRSALARTRKRSKQIATAIMNIGVSFLYIQFNEFQLKKIYPLTVL